MKWLGDAVTRLRNLGRRPRQDDDLREQIEAHLDEATEEFIRQGLSPADARRAARLSFGSVAGVEETCRDLRGGWRRDLSRDLGYGLRMLRRDRMFAAVAIVSLAVGIGANSAIFSIVNSMLLRPRPVADPDRLVELFTGHRGHAYEATSYPSYAEFRERNQVFTGLAAYGIWQFVLGDANEVEQIWGEPVSGNYFDVLGVRAAQGRTFRADEAENPGSEPAVVIGHALWQRRFNADPALVGRTITLNGRQLTVIGIAPPDYTGMLRGLSSEVWVPVSAMPVLDPLRGPAMFTSRGSRWVTMVGRLAPGITVRQAQARFEVLTREMQETHPEEWKSWRPETGGIRELFVTVLPESDTRMHPGVELSAYAIVALLMTVVNLLMFIACMNLAGMLLARAVVRRREIAVRLALGAGRFRIIRQLVAESVLLSLVAGAFGIVLAVWVLHLLFAFMPPLPEGIRVAFDVHLDWRVVTYTLALSTATGVLFGLAPALQSSKTDVASTLKDDASAFAGGRRHSRTRALLVVTQVALALLLLIGAGLVLRSLEKVRPTRLGFTSEDVVVVPLKLSEVRYDRRRSQSFYRDATERVAALPGVRTVSLVGAMPGGFLTRSRRDTEIEGYQAQPGESVEIDFAYVGPRYFTQMSVPIVQGRDVDLRDREGAPCVALVNEAFGRRYFPTLPSPLGKRLAKYDSDLVPTERMCEIVGVVRDDRFQSLETSPRPFYWMAVQQSYETEITMLVATDGNPAGHINAVRRAVQAVDPNLPLNGVQTLGTYFSATAYPFRLLGIVMATCGLIAVLLATVGVYGIVAYSVAQRTREVGIRIALGAVRSQIMRLLVGQGMALVVWGLAIGLLLSFALTRVLTSSIFETGLLFGVGATDSLTFAGVTLLLAVVALAACGIPAVRATRIDPVTALRRD